MPVITHSSLSSFKKCARLYYHQYVAQRVKIVEAPALALGRAYHIGLEAWWRAGGKLEAAVQAVQTAETGMEPADLAKVLAMLECYRPPIEHWDLEVLEQDFEAKIVNPETSGTMHGWTLRGRVDGIIISSDTGHRWVLEHKTTSEDIVAFGPYWQRLAIDQQVGLYLLATKAVGVVYDVSRKPTIKMCGKDASPDAYRQRCIAQRTDPAEWYQWREVVRTENDMDECRTDLWQSAHMLADCTRLGRWPRNAESCRSFYGTCTYLDVCTGCARLDDDTLFRTKISANEELLAA